MSFREAAESAGSADDPEALEVLGDAFLRLPRLPLHYRLLDKLLANRVQDMGLSSNHDYAHLLNPSIAPVDPRVHRPDRSSVLKHERMPLRM